MAAGCPIAYCGSGLQKQENYDADVALERELSFEIAQQQAAAAEAKINAEMAAYAAQQEALAKEAAAKAQAQQGCDWNPFSGHSCAAAAVSTAANVVTHIDPSTMAHLALGAATFIPVVGSAAAVANAGLYAYQGDYLDAGLSLLAVIPGGELAAEAGEGLEEADTALNTARELDQAASEAEQVTSEAEQVGIEAGPKPAAQLVRVVAEDESQGQVFREMAERTYNSGLEHSLVRSTAGDTAIYIGGETGMQLPENAAELIAHTHPYS